MEAEGHLGILTSAPAGIISGVGRDSAVLFFRPTAVVARIFLGFRLYSHSPD